MAHTADSTSAREEARVHRVGAKRYYVVWIALLVFTAITVLVGRVHLPHGWGLVVAMVIAATKATLVALFFMHLWDHGGANRLVLVTSIAFFFLLLGVVLLDNATRFSLTNPPTTENQRWQPPGPDILSPHGTASGAEGGPRRSSRHEGPRDVAPQQQGKQH
jgi:cytochrome c oxidase subunit 4